MFYKYNYYIIMNFSDTEMKNGIKFLKKNNYYYLFNNFKLPDKWHEIKKVDCVDNFILYKKNISYIDYDNKIIFDDDMGSSHDTYALFEEVFSKKKVSCEIFAIYLYELMILVKKIEKEEEYEDNKIQSAILEKYNEPDKFGDEDVIYKFL